ncbi:MAG TPA: PBP1A family penicillin-binding protein [Oligoflexia bacterium]|nr:PBP1A family penicillin-binding protein [Oligoflexia bacterium]
MFRFFVWILVTGGILSIIVGGFAGLYFYNRLNRDLPRIEKLSDYKPKAVTSFYAEDGTLLVEVWDERRYPVALSEIPLHVKNAFLAAEDASFYAHGGIDFLSIVRAAWVNLTSKATKQGASTITQQIVKELLLSRERTYQRKLKEALLSYRLEKYLTKDEILSIYLNQIFLGSGAYGIKAAAKVHFHKELENVSIAEAAFLGALPKKPSELTRPANREMAMNRQAYVLRQLRDKGFITEEEYRVAREEKLTIYPQEEENLFASPYFATHSVKLAEEIIQKVNSDYTLRDPGGFKIVTTVNVRADNLAQESLRLGLLSLDKRQGWRGALGNIRDDTRVPPKWDELKEGEPLSLGRIYRARVVSVDQPRGRVRIEMGEFKGEIDVGNAKWAFSFAELVPGASDIKRSVVNPLKILKIGDIIEVSVKKRESKEQESKPVYSLELDQTPAVQGAMVVMNAITGEVKSIIGGFDFKESKFNRATQGDLQPGSSFKPLIYLAAIEELGYTPSTIVPDEPISFPTLDGVWAPKNFDQKFLGPISFRVALQKSRNVVSVYLVQKIGIDKTIRSARRLGISTPIPRNMSISLGTPEVKVIDMVRSYAPFASGGYLPDLLIVKSISERDGREIYRAEPRQEKVIEPAPAFIMAHMMKGVIERGTAQVLKKLGRPVAGKTGTTNDHMDSWFIGYTPDWVAGVWVGFDSKRSLGKAETGGRVAAPIFLDFMEDFLEGTPALDFIPPDDVVPVSVNVHTGVPVPPGSEGAFIEYFQATGGQYSDMLGRNRDPYQQKSHEVEDYLTNSDF